MADKTYKQWYDYHLSQLKKDPNFKSASDSEIKATAELQARRSFNAQEQANKTPGGNLSTPAGTGIDTTVGRTTTPTGNVVGRGGDTASTPPTTSRKPTTGIIKNINDRLATGGYTVDVDVTVDEALSSLTKAQKTQIAALLDKAGFTVRTLADVDAVVSEILPNAQWGSFADLFRQIKEQIVVGKGEEPKPDLARTIVKYDEAVLKEVAQSIALNKIGKTLTDEELQGAVDLANSMIAKGTVTKVKNVRNKKTGKLEQITETTPGFSQERFGTELGMKLEQESPQLVERRKAFEFVDEMSKILSGGM